MTTHHLTQADAGTYRPDSVGRDTAVMVANQRYWQGVTDGLAHGILLRPR